MTQSLPDFCLPIGRYPTSAQAEIHRGLQETMYVQIVNFKLRPDTSCAAFLELTEQMIAWLKNQDGFVAYELYKGADCWLDRIAWKSAKHAQDGLSEFLSTEIAQLMLPLVESDYNSFFGEAIVSA